MTGRVLRVAADAAVIAVGGVGLRVEMPTGDLADLGEHATVYTVLQVRDEEVHLYGFATQEARDLFRALTSVSGVGPKLGLAVLSFHSPQAVQRAIAAGDADALGAVPGIGSKLAQRIVLELKDKVGGPGAAQPVSGPLAEVREALRGLGYSPQEVQEAVAGLPPDGDAPTLLRHALRALGSRERAGAP